MTNAERIHYIPSLDGLRAIAIALVIGSHAGFGGIVPGGLGVTLFFVISGYIITRLLLAEQAARGRIAFGAFTRQRLLRLYPSLLAFIAIASAVLLALGPAPSLAALASALFYGANYVQLAGGYPAFAPEVPHPFAILWSLAIEQHFYLIFPPLLIACLRLGRPVPLLLAGAFAVQGWRLVVLEACRAEGWLCGPSPAWRLYMGTDTRFDALLFGAALAVFLARGGRIPLWAFGLGLAGLLGSLLWREESFRESWRYTVQGVAIAALLGPLLFSPALGWARGLLSLGPLLALGRASYVAYLFHWLAVLLACRLTGEPMEDVLHSPAWFALAGGLTLAGVGGVYFAVERPMALWRRRLKAAAAARAASASTAAAPRADSGATGDAVR